MRNPNTLNYEFDSIPARMLDQWFEERIKKYNGTPAEEHYRNVYWVMSAPASELDSLANFYKQHEEEWTKADYYG